MVIKMNYYLQRYFILSIYANGAKKLVSVKSILTDTIMLKKNHDTRSPCSPAIRGRG